MMLASSGQQSSRYQPTGNGKMMIRYTTRSSMLIQASCHQHTPSRANISKSYAKKIARFNFVTKMDHLGAGQYGSQCARSSKRSRRQASKHGYLVDYHPYHLRRTLPAPGSLYLAIKALATDQLRLSACRMDTGKNPCLRMESLYRTIRAKRANNPPGLVMI